jgi:mRNA interferase HigB
LLILICGDLRMRIISVKKLKDFWNAGYADAEQPLKVWYQICKQQDFLDPNEIKCLFSSASFLNNNRIVFNISGNKYRLITHIRYDIKIIYIRFIGTHAEYNKVNAKEV